MSVGLTLSVEVGELERVDAELAATGFFSDDRPLRGQAGRADWRLCGLISRLLLEGRLRGERGEALLVPSAGSLRAPRLLLVGLGTRSQFQDSSLREAMRDLAARSLALGLRRVAIAPPGIAPEQLADRVPVLLDGLFESIRASRADSLDLRLVTPHTEALDGFLESIETSLKTGSYEAQWRFIPPAHRSRGRASAPRG